MGLIMADNGTANRECATGKNAKRERMFVTIAETNTEQSVFTQRTKILSAATDANRRIDASLDWMMKPGYASNADVNTR